MIRSTLEIIFKRNLNKLRSEIELYENENKIWIIEKEITNSAGNLTLHLIGNLNTYIGAQFGKTNYIRNRELEFSQKNIPKQELIKSIEETIIMVENALNKVTEEDLKQEYPILVFDKKTSTEYFLIHLTSHLAYHLGQINYHRRMVNNN